MIHFDFGFVTSMGSSTLYSLSVVLFQLYFFKVSSCIRVCDPALPYHSTTFTFITSHQAIKQVYLLGQLQQTAFWDLWRLSRKRARTELGVCCGHGDWDWCHQHQLCVKHANTYICFPSQASSLISWVCATFISRPSSMPLLRSPPHTEQRSLSFPSHQP